MELGRRDLMVGAAALAASSTGCLAQPAPRKMGYAIVGLGGYGLGIIIPQFANCEKSRLAALVSGDPAKARRVAAEHGLPDSAIYSYETFDRIRDNPDVDIVYVCLPNSMHAEYTIRAARAGKHVMCEKPMAVSVKECEAMIAAWHGIAPPNAAARVMAADLVATIRAFEAVRDQMRFEDEPASFEAALQETKE